MRSQIAAIVGVLLVYVAASPAVAQDQQAMGYTKDEIDRKLKDLESKSDADLRMGEFYKRGEVDDLLDDLRKSIPQGATKTDFDNKIADAQKVLRAELDLAEQRNVQRKSDLEAQIRLVEAKIPAFPAWVSPLIAGLALLVAIGSAVISYMNVDRGAQEARRAAREARADGTIEQWQSLADKIRVVRDIFADLNLLFNADGTPNLHNYALIADVGNWYERMADQW